MSDTEMTKVVLNALPEEWGNFNISLFENKEATPFHDLGSLCKIEETRLKAKGVTGSSKGNQVFIATSRKKGRFCKFGPHNSMDKARCFGCDELGHYKRDCPKSEKDKRNREEAHISEMREEPDAKKSKKEEARDLHYD